jgi:hypothetical protein
VDGARVAVREGQRLLAVGRGQHLVAGGLVTTSRMPSSSSAPPSNAGPRADSGMEVSRHRDDSAPGDHRADDKGGTMHNTTTAHIAGLAAVSPAA